MDLTHQTQWILPDDLPTPVQRALAALRRDWERVFLPSDAPGGSICLRPAEDLPPEAYTLRVRDDTLVLCAGDALGFIYGLYTISKELLDVKPFWFWCDQKFAPVSRIEVPSDWQRQSRPAAVRWRGWFLNDETLLSHWSYRRRAEGPWEMAFEALLRCGGNLVIPGTDANAHQYRALAASYGLTITHHHAEPLGAEMFARAYPDLTPSFAQYPDLFRGLWRTALHDQRELSVLWNIGFRGQGDKPFWADDPQYDTPAARGALMSRLIREQYDLVKAQDPAATCCTNLYGETMELYQQGLLDLPEDVIKIWADNGYGKMVSRRQGNNNPRVPALPRPDDGTAHGLYYHVSFYDLQAASHITMLPNPAEFVCAELTNALQCGVRDFWLINCSNIKPHTYLLDLIAQLWQDGTADPAAHRRAYAAAYYGAEYADAVADCLAAYADHAVPYGPHADDRAGDQFYNHVVRMMLSQAMRDRTAPAVELRWLAAGDSLREQRQGIAPMFAAAQQSYAGYLRECEAVYATMDGPARVLFADTVLLQAQLYALWSRGAAMACESLQAALEGAYQRAFYLAGHAQHAYAAADRALRDREHGKWIDFYANECQTDVKQTAAVCAAWMSYLRNLGEGPHFYRWQRQYEDSEADRRVMLILNTTNHPTDEQLWRWMEQWEGE